MSKKIEENGIIYEIYNDYVNVFECADKNIKNAVIVDNIDGIPVTSIDYDAFLRCTLLTSITIPNGIIHIGSYAFFGCKSLKSVTIPDSVTIVGDGVFDYCDSLKRIEGKFTTFPPRLEFLDLLDELNKKYCKIIKDGE